MSKDKTRFIKNFSLQATTKNNTQKCLTENILLLAYYEKFLKTPEIFTFP